MNLDTLAEKSRSLFGSFCERMAGLDLRAAAALPAAIGVCAALYGIGLEVHGQGELLQHGGHMALEAYKAAMQAVPIDSMSEYVRLALAGEHRSFGGNEQGVGFVAATAGPAFTTAAVLLARGFQAMREFVSGRVNRTAEAAPSGIVSTFGGTSLALQSAKQAASTRLDNQILSEIAGDQEKYKADVQDELDEDCPDYFESVECGSQEEWDALTDLERERQWDVFHDRNAEGTADELYFYDVMMAQHLVGYVGD